MNCHICLFHLPPAYVIDGINLSGIAIGNGVMDMLIQVTFYAQ